MSARRPLSSSVPQAEAPARIPGEPVHDANPHASKVAALAPTGAATHTLRLGETVAAIAAGVTVALAGALPAAAASSDDVATASDGPLAVVLLLVVTVLVIAALVHGRPRRVRHVEPGCCLVEHGPADDDEIAAAVGER